MTRALAYAGLACAVLAFAVAMCEGIAHAQQCNCPAPVEPTPVAATTAGIAAGGRVRVVAVGARGCEVKRLWGILLCCVRLHDWDYFTMTNLDGTPANFRCCLRCERSEELAQ